MQRALSLTQSTIGKKVVMAVTGMVLYGFVVVHMLGNLQVFLGPNAINAYAAQLKSVPPLLWGARAVLAASVVLHVHAATSLVVRSEIARPVGYRMRRYRAATASSLSMKYGGAALLAFLLFHLAHFTFPGVAMGSYRHSATDVYANVVNGLSVGWVTAIYVVAQVLLGMHLFHGSSSMLVTLGLSHPRYERLLTVLPRALGATVALGNIAIALAVYAGLVR
jgi:succinate dehydrogenase / fumarate reductase cytochrome b subunit